jgi:hypothetical protein
VPRGWKTGPKISVFGFASTKFTCGFHILLNSLYQLKKCVNLGALVMTTITRKAIYAPGSTLIMASLLSKCRSIVGKFWLLEDIYSPVPPVLESSARGMHPHKEAQIPLKQELITCLRES